MRLEEMIGRRVRDVRELNEMTQQEVGEKLAHLLGKPWSRQAVSAAEQGNRAFTAAELVAIAQVIGTTVARLFSPPLDADEIELPSGATVPRSTYVESTMQRVSSAKSIAHMRDTIEIMANANAAAAKHNHLVNKGIAGLIEAIEATAEINEFEHNNGGHDK
ncbi:helix-turn-helix transcriptional regulator [Amycolatopsis cihanbeyliensis]|uniref:Helix-turn-helix protein n=1 Tax=Amycolatopsis cihanbeyliensis TaxID=1128664 RepID=A0A542DMG0_AMYCI|nr:helix-turn-helix transcriptional regulator [Amycolatopsis cihanbeyliensis]TQJ04269.1 helix-turn-helix protein [Amycolatopsis cihanbeyliensis]